MSGAFILVAMLLAVPAYWLTRPKRSLPVWTIGAALAFGALACAITGWSIELGYI